MQRQARITVLCTVQIQCNANGGVVPEIYDMVVDEISGSQPVFVTGKGEDGFLRPMKTAQEFREMLTPKDLLARRPRWSFRKLAGHPDDLQLTVKLAVPFEVVMNTTPHREQVVCTEYSTALVGLDAPSFCLVQQVALLAAKRAFPDCRVVELHGNIYFPRTTIVSDTVVCISEC